MTVSGVAFYGGGQPLVVAILAWRLACGYLKIMAPWVLSLELPTVEGYRFFGIVFMVLEYVQNYTKG